MTSPRVKAGLVLVMIFILGGVAGGALAVRVVTHRFAELFKGDPKQTLAHLYGEELGRRIHLTAAQRAEVESIVNDDHAELAHVGQSVYAELSEMRSRRHARIRALLSPEQRPAFDVLAADYERRRRVEIDLPP